MISTKVFPIEEPTWLPIFNPLRSATFVIFNSFRAMTREVFPTFSIWAIATRPPLS